MLTPREEMYKLAEEIKKIADERFGKYKVIEVCIATKQHTCISGFSDDRDARMFLMERRAEMEDVWQPGSEESLYYLEVGL